MSQVATSYIKENRQEYINELIEFLRIPSISSISDHKGDVRDAANWTVEALKTAGMQKAEIMETPGHPVVYGEWTSADNDHTVLIYGHYDVQPVDPVELWDSPPFEPIVHEEKLFARGASDDKGQTFMHVKAVQALLATKGSLPFNVKFLIEGEEEIGSPSLDEFVQSNEQLLSADVLLISDTPMLGKGRPAVCKGLRGMCSLQIDVKGAKGDLHSGLYGGAVQNSVHALVQLLDTLRDEDGRIQVKGFYDDVIEPTEEERASYAQLGDFESELKEELHLNELFGEKGYTAREHTWVRPTLEINGIYGGFQGEGVKTVIPSEAHAKITCRLVPGQDPDVIIQQIEEHLQSHTPPGVTLTTTRYDQGKPFLAPTDHPAFKTATDAYEAVYGTPAVFTRMGGSIPVVETFDQVLNIPILLMGFGLPSENFHAPNEHFHLENFDKGMETLIYFWETLQFEK
ncbi:dipeptidase [Alkalicoccobacillus porphyridii]|nr:dipeptidase [Alkalicoccobacillus porphyridii]